MQKLIPILDNGHGGIINGNYQTGGKRSPNWDMGVLFEGAFNRWIVNGIMLALDHLKIPYYHVSPELRDITLKTRVARANKIYQKNPNAFLLSIHANAGGGTGIEGFTSYGQTSSDPIADRFLSVLENDFPNEKMRFDTYSDGDKDKEASYQVLTKTIGKAVLLELGFMDHPEDYKRLWDPWNRQEKINSIVHVIKEFN